TSAYAIKPRPSKPSLTPDASATPCQHSSSPTTSIGDTMKPAGVAPATETRVPSARAALYWGHEERSRTRPTPLWPRGAGVAPDPVAETKTKIFNCFKEIFLFVSLSVLALSLPFSVTPTLPLEHSSSNINGLAHARR